MIRVTIRDLMLLVLHAAIALSIVVGFRRLWVGDLSMLALTLSLYIPIASGIVSAVTMRPGPHRDWVTAVCFAGPMLGLALYFAVVSVILAPGSSGRSRDGETGVPASVADYPA